MSPRTKYRRAIIDASNVAHSGEGGAARTRYIRLMWDKLAEVGYEPIVVADAALRHQVDDADSYERLVESGVVHQAPAGTDADYFILNFARELEAVVVSNDRFRDRLGSFPELRRRLVRYMIVEDEVVLERRNGRRGGRGADRGPRDIGTA
ncbi:MAG TPA: hypothetical protein VFS08_02080 [Gemmatimonadaceae bacterium]|nr:hypothetical protein [Gemmatimonadaceae bacterium]